MKFMHSMPQSHSPQFCVQKGLLGSPGPIAEMHIPEAQSILKLQVPPSGSWLDGTQAPAPPARLMQAFPSPQSGLPLGLQVSLQKKPGSPGLETHRFVVHSLPPRQASPSSLSTEPGMQAP